MGRVAWLIGVILISCTSIKANPDVLKADMSIIAGKVVSKQTRPLEHAFVGVYNNEGVLKYVANTNEEGAFSLLVPAGVYSIVAVYDGYSKVAFDSVHLSGKSYTEFHFRMTGSTNNLYYLDDLYYWEALRVKTIKGKKTEKDGDIKFRVMNSSAKMLRLEYNTERAQKVIAEIFNDYGELVYTFEHEINPEKCKYYERLPELQNGNYYLMLNRQQHLNHAFSINTDR